MSDDDLRLYEGDVVHLGNGLGHYEVVEAKHRRTKTDRSHCKQIDGDGTVWWGPHHLTDVLEYDDARLVRADERDSDLLPDGGTVVEDDHLTRDGIDEDAEPQTCARCGATFYLATRGGAFTSVSISHHGQPNVEDYAESLCESCGADLDTFMCGLAIETALRDD